MDIPNLLEIELFICEYIFLMSRGKTQSYP